MLSGILPESSRKLYSQTSENNRYYHAYIPDKELRCQTSSQCHTTRLDRQTSNKLFRLYYSVKKSEALSALKFQRREQVQGQEHLWWWRDYSGGGGGLIIEDWKIAVICLVLCLHQSLFLDPNLCVRWQQKRYLQVHKCQSQFQAGRLLSVNLMPVLK